MLKNIKKQKNKNSGVLVKFPKRKQDKRIDYLLLVLAPETMQICRFKRCSFKT